MKKNTLIKVVIAILLAIFAGWMTDQHTVIGEISVVRFYHLLGQLFLNALMCVVIPLVVTSIMSSMAQMGVEGSLKTLGKKIIGTFILTSFLAACVGFLCVWAIQPGNAQEFFISIPAHTTVDSFGQVEGILYKMVPQNIVMAAAQGHILGLIFFSMLFGYFIGKIDSDYATAILRVVKGVYDIMIHMTHFIMRALPFGVFGLMAEAVATTGLEAMRSALWFLLTVIVAMGLYTLIVMPLLLRFKGINPIAHFRTVLPALLTAFSTSSSAAALPVMIECMEKKGRHTRRICHLTLPLGSSLNLPGTALFICISVCFLTQLYGIKMSLGMEAVVIFLSLLTSFGMAGIPSASLVALLLVLHILGLPPQGMGLILAVERILDMFRSALNVLGNTCSTAFVVGEEKEEADVLEAAI